MLNGMEFSYVKLVVSLTTRALKTQYQPVATTSGSNVWQN